MKKKLRKVINEVVAEHFPVGAIADIRIARDVDVDGDPVILLKLIVAEGAVIESSRRTSLVRNLLPRLNGIGEPGFPITYYIQQRDAGDEPAEAA